MTCFRHLATNLAHSVNKGERVVVTGTLRIREWESSEAKGTTAEVEAEAAGHDLTWGTSTFPRPTVPAQGAADEDSGDTSAT